MIGISADDLETHRRFAEKYSIGFPLVSDSSREVRDLYDSGRVTYLIDKDGRIRYKEEGIPDTAAFLKEAGKL